MPYASGITAAKNLSSIKKPVVLPVKLCLKNDRESQNIIVAMKADIRQATQERIRFKLSFCMYCTRVIEICSLDLVVSIAAKRDDTKKRRIIKCREKGTKILKSLKRISVTGNRAIKIRAA